MPYLMRKVKRESHDDHHGKKLHDPELLHFPGTHDLPEPPGIRRASVSDRTPGTAHVRISGKGSKIPLHRPEESPRRFQPLQKEIRLTAEWLTVGMTDN